MPYSAGWQRWPRSRTYWFVHGPLWGPCWGYTAALLVALFVLLLIVWGTFKMHSEYTAMSPEFLAGVAMLGFQVFAIFPRAHCLWRWLPGLG
jgi:hypothetical protein